MYWYVHMNLAKRSLVILKCAVLATLVWVSYEFV